MRERLVLTTNWSQFNSEGRSVPLWDTELQKIPQKASGSYAVLLGF